jgi:hypothetical protein
VVIPAQGSRAIILFITGAAGCRKYSSHPAQVLPPETHLGLNNMGAYVNGKLFMISMDLDSIQLTQGTTYTLDELLIALITNLLRLIMGLIFVQLITAC